MLAVSAHLRSKASVDEDQLGQRASAKAGAVRVAPAARAAVETKVDAAQRGQAGVLPLLQPGGGKSEGVKSIGSLLPHAPDEFRFGDRGQRHDAAEPDVAFDSCRHRAAA